MSHIEGADDLLKKLEAFGQNVGRLTYELHDNEMSELQSEAAEAGLTLLSDERNDEGVAVLVA